MAAIPSQIYFRYKYGYAFWRCKSICTPNFDQISQSTAEILLIFVSEKKRSPYWNSTSGFDFGIFTVIGMWFSIGLPNFIEIRSSAAALWRHSAFQDGGRQPSGIWFRVMVAHPQSACGGCCFSSNSGLIGFTVLEIVRFSYLALWLETAYSRALLGMREVWGIWCHLSL